MSADEFLNGVENLQNLRWDKQISPMLLRMHNELKSNHICPPRETTLYRINVLMTGHNWSIALTNAQLVKIKSHLNDRQERRHILSTSSTSEKTCFINMGDWTQPFNHLYESIINLNQSHSTKETKSLWLRRITGYMSLRMYYLVTSSCLINLRNKLRGANLHTSILMIHNKGSKWLHLFDQLF